MIKTRNLEAEANSLVVGGVAKDLDHAFAIIHDLDRVREKSDSVLFYVNPVIKHNFPIVSRDEGTYNNTRIRFAQVPSGALNLDFSSVGIALGKIIEYVPRESSESVLAARISKFPHGDFDGFYLTPFSAEAVRRKGSRTFEDRYAQDMGVNLERIEFSHVKGDYLIGMFAEWGNRFGAEVPHLVLSIPRRHFLQVLQ